MKKLFSSILILLSIQYTNAQINAITESGDEVILYKNGTWEYLNDSIIEISNIIINDKKFVKDKNSVFLVKSNKLNIGIWINPKIWSFTKGKDNDVYEFKFRKKDDDLYAFFISERIQVPIETLKKAAIENAKSIAPDIKIIKEEFRIVNEIQVLMMQMSGTIQGVKFTYYGYYYSNLNGTFQFLTYTSENLFNDYLIDIDLFLNGLVEL